MKIFQILFICISSYIFCQVENDSLKTIRLNAEYKIENDRKRDSLSIEIKKNIHNYEAILGHYYTEYDEFLEQPENYNFYKNIFDKIENDKDLKPDFYRVKYSVFSLSKNEDERIQFLLVGFNKFPKDRNINSFLEILYRSKFRSAEKDKAKYAHSTIKHLEILNKLDLSELEKIQNLLKLKDLYSFLGNDKKVENFQRKIYAKPFKGFSIEKIMSKENLSKNDRASGNLSSRLHYISIFSDLKKEFKIENNLSNNYFNFLWMRSFFRNIAITIEQRNNGYFLITKISDKAESISPNTIKEKKISEKEFQKFIEILSKENLENISMEDNPGNDGSLWFLESYHKNNRSLRFEWTPKINCETASSYCSFVNACKYLIELSEIKTLAERKLEEDGHYEYDPTENDGFYLY